MDQSILVEEKITAGDQFLQEFKNYLPVNSAFWLKRDDDDPLTLYVVSGEITDDNFDVAYGEVLRIASKLKNPNFDPFQVKWLPVDDPLAKAAISVYETYPAPIPTRIRGGFFGGRTVEEVYIYPPVDSPVTAKP